MYFSPSKTNRKMQNINIKALLYSYFIKYDKLRELTSEAFSGSDSNQLRVYIDAYDILRFIYNRSLLGPDGIFESSSNVLTSALLNLVAHIRAFYAGSDYHVETEFYIVFSDMPRSADIYCHNVHFDKIIDANLKMLRVLCPFIPGVYLLERTVDPSVVITTDIIQHIEAKFDCPSIIISRDLNMWQIPCHFSNVAVFRPRKGQSGDSSFCVNQRNVLSVYRDHRKLTKTILEGIITPGMLPLYIAMTSSPELNLPMYYSAQKAIDILKKLVEQNKIINGYNSPDAISGVLNTIGIHVGLMEARPTSLYIRYKSIDVMSKAILYKTKPESAYIHAVQLADPRGVEQINETYFKDNPIDIIHLFYR